MKVLIVGQNPSLHNSNKYVAFLGSKSGDTLIKWLKYLEITDYELTNCFEELNPIINKKTYEIAAAEIDFKTYLLQTDKIITLGKVAAKVLKKANLSFFELPHPSGRNRKLNNKKWLEKQLTLAKQYLEVK